MDIIDIDIIVVTIVNAAANGMQLAWPNKIYTHKNWQ